MSPNSKNGNLSLAGPGRDLLADIPDALPSPALGQLTRDILDDVFHNIIYDIVSKVHREEKVSRAVSAAVVTQGLADKEIAAHEASSATTTTAAENGEHNTTGADKESKAVKVETQGATYEDGRVRLRGNPLETTREIVCPDCRLPRLLYPLFGEGARPAPDPNKEYCRKQPPVRLPGRDVHGRPFAVEKATKKKKKGAASPASPPSSPTSTPHGSSLKQLPGKAYVPSVKCPNCPRYFFLTRIAQHLDRCMGISTRQSSRNRTPMDSGLSTPASSQVAGAKRSRGPEGEEEAGSAGAGVKKKKGPAGPSKLRNNEPGKASPAEKE